MMMNSSRRSKFSISSGRKIENTRINNIHHNCGERNKKRKEIETFNRNTKQKSLETIKPNHQTIETRSFHSRNRTKLATDSIRNARNNSKSIDELILIENNQTNGNRQSNKASNIDRIHSPPPPPPPPSSSNESNLANPQLIENLQIVKPNLKRFDSSSVDQVKYCHRIENNMSSANSKSNGSQHLSNGSANTESNLCRVCLKHVYHMEQIKAVKSVFHKSCFRCSKCNKPLNMDSYSSHEGSIYCQLHFKQLFQPKPNFDSNNNDKHLQNSNMDRNDLNATNERNDDDDDDDNDDDYDYGDGGTDNRIKKFNNSTKDSSLGNDIIEAIQKPRKYELIVCENTPVELPPDVIRYDQKQEDVFENLNLNLNSIRNRFENGLVQNEVKDSTKRSSDSVKPISKSESIHKIMQKYQNRVAGKNHSCSSSDDEENQLDQLDDSNHHHRDHHNDSSHRERVSFSGMSNLKNQWETGSFGAENKNDSRSMTENELAEIRRHGKPLKQMYERAVQEAKSNENLSNKHPEAVLADGIVKTETLKAKFENGSLDETDEDRIVRLRKERETEINQIVHNDLALKEARQKFKQIEAKQNNESSSLQDHQCPTAAVAADVSIDAEQLQQRFNYFENHNGINEEEQDRNTSKSVLNDLPKVDTTKKMLSKFKALESGNSNENSVNLNQGPKAPIRITPPRETAKVYENEPVVERDPNIVKSSYKTEEIIQVEPEKAKSLRAKFENWNADDERGNRKNSTEDNELAQFERDSTKNLRAMFESIQNEPKKIERPKPRVNRFVQDKQYQQNELCYVCLIRIYPMEKLEFSGMKLHKNCFRCNKCHMPLRLDNFTQHTEKLFCIPHFKQLFMQKGNYDEGFGREQHKDKWSNKSSNCDNQHRQSTVLASHASSSQNGLIEINGNQSDESTELIDGHLLPDQSISLNGHQFYANINSNERLVENY